MKLLAALLAVLSMTGCAHCIPSRADTDEEKRRVPVMLVVCIFASCRDIFKPEQQETPTPSSSSRKGESAPDLHASRLATGTRRKGIGPN